MIQSIHVGYNEGTGGQLTEELEALLAEKDVAIISGQNQKIKGTLDLVCQKVTFVPEPPRVGEDITFSCLIKNKGTATVQGRSYKIGLMIDRQQVYMGIGNDDLSGGTETLYSVNSIDWSMAVKKAGTFNYMIMVDPDNAISETNESNNLLSGKITVIK